MSEPATKLERDIVFRKLRGKSENKVSEPKIYHGVSGALLA